MSKKAICLFSGGLDSTTVLYHALNEGYEVFCLSFDYAQRHKRELEAAATIAKELKVKHKTVSIELPWGGSCLTDLSIDVPKHEEGSIGNEIPITYVPGRNIIFLSIAASWAEVVGADTLFIGANQLDYSGYPDCREDFLVAFEEMVNKGTKAGVEGEKIKVLAPLLFKTKVEIVQLAVSLGVPVDKTWSCYEGSDLPCGVCDSCLLRESAFQAIREKSIEHG